MVAQPVAWYDKPGSPALPEASSVSHRTMAMNGEVSAAAHTGGAAAPGGAHRDHPYSTAAAAAATGAAAAAGGAAAASDSSPGRSPGGFSDLLARTMAANTAGRVMTAPMGVAVSTPLTPPTRTPGIVSPPQMMAPPSAGCSVEELRLFVMQIHRQQGLEIQELEGRIIESVNPIKQALDGCVRTSTCLPTSSTS